MVELPMPSVRVRKETGKLFIDFRYRKVRCREQTALDDTPENRKRLDKLLKKIEAEITLGTFNYKSYFPESGNAQKFDELTSSSLNSSGAVSGAQEASNRCPNFKEFANEWFGENEVRWRRSHRATIRGTLDQHLIPAFIEKTVDQITKADILKLRSSLAKIPGRRKKEGLSTTRINHILTPLRMIMNEAADRPPVSG
jgi:integrase